MSGNNSGQSLTPLSRRQEIADASVNEGYLAALATFVPSTASVLFALKKFPNFAAKTNMQSRTALVIMPPFFVFALTSEMKVGQKMEQMATEAHHAKEVEEWHQKERKPQMFRYLGGGGGSDHRDSDVRQQEMQMMNVYRKSIENSGVRIVPGDSLSIHHVVSNFIQEHPFKLLAFIGGPSVAYIMYYKSQQGHLQVQQQLMHTRVIGQFAVIGVLLTFMGFKTYMDTYGKFITNSEMDLRVEDMQISRQHFLETLRKGEERERYIKELEKRVEEESDKEKAESLTKTEAIEMVQDK